jgi:hypothetical protein
MSLIKANAVQIGQSPTATQNFTLAVPSSPDGTIKLARGNSGATTQDVLTVDASGNINGNVLATGTTTARNLATRFADVVNVKDFGAVCDGVADDTAAIQAAIDVQKGPVFLPNGIYLVSSEIVIKDGTGIIGENPFWKRRTGYVYTGDKNTVIKYVGAGGTNSCVIRASKKAVGVEGTNFGATGDDLINIQLINFHIDSNALAEYGCYIYRAGNCGNVIDRITCEKSKKANHVHLGCYAAKFGVFGAYQGEDHGVICGVDIFSWNSVEATNFAYSAHFLTANNGTSNTYPADDVSCSGGRFSVGRGSNIVITSEGNIGRACILSQYNSASFAGGSTDYVLEYLEGNGDGPYIDYRDGMDAIRLRCGFIHPGNGTTLLPQNIKIEGKNNSGVVTPNSGPSTSSEWLVIDGAVGDLSGTGFDINSNTFKYNVINCTESITYSDKTPAVTRNTDNLVNAGVYFTAEISPTIWKAINGTLTRTAVGVYLFTFLQPFKTAGAVIPQVSIIVDVGAPYDTKVRISSINTTSVTIRTYDNADVLTDTGDRISLLLTGALE